MLTNDVVIFKDDKNGLILFEIDGRIAAKMKISDWSKALANPRRVAAERYDFSPKEPA